MSHFFESSNETIIQKVERKKKIEKKDIFSQTIEDFQKELEIITGGENKKFNKKFERFIKNYKTSKNLTEEQINRFNDFIANIDRSVLSKSNEKKIIQILGEEKINEECTVELKNFERKREDIIERKEENHNVLLVKVMKVDNREEREEQIISILKSVTDKSSINENIINKLVMQNFSLDFLLNFTKKFNFQSAFLHCNYLRKNFIETEDEEFKLYYLIINGTYEEAKAYYIGIMDENSYENLAQFKYKILYELGRRAAKKSDFEFALEIFIKIKNYFFDQLEDEIVIDSVFENFFYQIDILLISQPEIIFSKKKYQNVFSDFIDRFKQYEENELNIFTGNIQMEIFRCFYEKEIGNKEVANSILTGLNKKLLFYLEKIIHGF